MLIEEYNRRLELATAELHDIERTNDKSRRLRWRELKKIITYYKRLIAYEQHSNS